MGDECRVIYEIDYYKESIELLFRIANKNSYQNLKVDMLKRTETREHEKISRQLDKLSIIEEYIRKNTDITHSDIQFFFKRFVFDDLCIAKILYQSMRHTIFQSDTKAVKNYIKQSFENIKNDNSLELTLCSYEISLSRYENNKTASITERIDNLECDAAQKWQILDLIDSSEKYLDKLFSLLDFTIQKMKKYEEILNELKEDATNYWKEYFTNNEFMKLIHIFYNIKEDSYPDKDSYICVSLMNCDRVIFHGNDENAGDYHILDIGLTFDCEFRATKNSLTNQQLCNGLKLLSDPSKFEILCFIKDKKAYGQEIAAELNLSTATISHHMNTLIVLGLIDIEKVENRTYYQMNKEAVNNLLEETKNILI